MALHSRRDEPGEGGWPGIRATSLSLALVLAWTGLVSTGPARAADILPLRGAFGKFQALPPAPRAGRADAFGPLDMPGDGDDLTDFRPVDDVVGRDEIIRPPADLQDLPVQRQDSSILRIGEPRRARSVADGRVDRPAPRPGSAGALPGGDTEGGIVVVRQDVRYLIAQVARFYGFDTVLTRQVQGELANARLPSNFSAFLDRLSEDRDIVFYFRDRELNASARSENVSRVIGLGPSNPRELREAIEAAGVDADRFPLKFIETSNSVLVNGPPSFVGLVEVIAESLVRTDRTAQDVTVIRGNEIERTSTDTLRAPAAAAPAPPPPVQ